MSRRRLVGRLRLLALLLLENVLHYRHAVLDLERIHLVDLAKQLVHVLQTDALGFGPEEQNHGKTHQVDGHQDPVRVVAHVVEHDRPRLVNPQRRHLLCGLGDVHAFVPHLRGEDLAGVDPGAGTEGTAVGLQVQTQLARNALTYLGEPTISIT